MGQRRRVLSPDRSPLHRLGAQLRLWRDRRHLSLSDLGALVFYDASHLGKFERAEKYPPRHVVEACDRVLEAGGDLIHLWEQIPGRRNPAGAASVAVDEASSGFHEANLVVPFVPDRQQAALWMEAGEITLPARTADGRIVLVTISRRSLLQGIGASAVAATAMETASAIAPLRAYAATVGDDVHPVEHFEQVRRALADSDNLLGPGHVMQAVRTQIGIIHDRRLASRGSDRLGLLRVQVQFADLLGWLHQDSGDHGMARHWLDRALEWSHLDPDSPAAPAFILARKAQLAGDGRDGDETIELAQAAARLVPPRSRFVAIALTYGAHGHALQGELDACRRHYDQAHDLLDRIVPDEQPWGQFFNHGYIDVQRAQSLAVLGRHREAAAGFAAAITSLPAGFHRDQGVYLARQAVAHAGAADADQAAACGLRALAIGIETDSDRIMKMLVRLDSDAARWRRSVAGLGELHQALEARLCRRT
ncbi:MAG: helix-turn-helix domain-containing protein [Micromonosporaceae bacterium]|nr:helix-turn-helix domain-containing protein [Micromonosporaceae bacterium]